MLPRLLIDGREARLERLWRPEMSLSSSRAGRKAAPYALAIERVTLLSILSGIYEARVRDLKEDDRVTGSTDLFGQAGYPPLDALLHMPELLTLVIRGYFEEEVFAAVLQPASGKMLGTWAIDTVETVRLVGEQVLVEGTCYAF
jgi:hypothetical protein